MPKIKWLHVLSYNQEVSCVNEFNSDLQNMLLSLSKLFHDSIEPRRNIVASAAKREFHPFGWIIIRVLHRSVHTIEIIHAWS